MIDATHLKAHRTASSLKKRAPAPRRIGRTKGEMNTKLHALGDGADVLLPSLPSAKVLIADRSDHSIKVRKIFEHQKIEACIPSRKNRKEPIPHCKPTQKNVTRSRTSLQNSKTGDALHCDTTDVTTHSSQLS